MGRTADIRSHARARISLRLPHYATARQQREIGAFARYCILRVERELGEREAWVVNLIPTRGGYTSHIAVYERGMIVEDSGAGADGPLAVWDVMCRIEQRM